MELEAALEEKRESLLEEWEALGTVRRTKAQRVSDELRAMREVLASRGVAGPRRGRPTFEEESYAASELADDYEYSAYDDEYDEYASWGLTTTTTTRTRTAAATTRTPTSTSVCTRTTTRVRG